MTVHPYACPDCGLRYEVDVQPPPWPVPRVRLADGTERPARRCDRCVDRGLAFRRRHPIKHEALRADHPRRQRGVFE